MKYHLWIATGLFVFSSCSSYNMIIREKRLNECNPIKINQIGYLPEEKKELISSEAALKYIIRDSESGDEVFSGSMRYSGFDDDTDMEIYSGDFSDFQDNGRFLAEVVGVGMSYPFTIDNRVYDDALKLSSRFFYLQRSGTVIRLNDKNDTSVPGGHFKKASEWKNPSVHRDVSGGWYDAGDFGRYIPTGAFSVNQLLYAYTMNPDVHKDGSLDIPEFNNGIPDLLDEIKWELSWMLKMQKDNGAVYHKVTTRDYPEMGTIPSEDENPLFLFGPTSSDTAYFTGAMARSSMILGPWDPSFAERCREAALRSYAWLKNNPDQYPPGGFQNPPPSKYPMQGGYDFFGSEDHARMWAASEIFSLTGNEDALEDFQKLFRKSQVNDDFIKMDWSDPYGMALYAYLSSSSSENKGTFYVEVFDNFIKQADQIVEIAEESLFHTALKGRSGSFAYVWGSNQVVSANGLELLMAYSLTENPIYLESAYNQIQYLLGCNGLSKIYLSGIGTDPVKYPHHNLSIHLESAIPGIVGEGPNGAAQAGSGGDVQLKKLWRKDTPPALCYVDSSESYATNEPTIDANASFTALLSYFAR